MNTFALHTDASRQQSLEDPRATPRSGTSTLPLGVFLILEGLLALAPMAILGPAIGWPASLDAPAAQQLGAIAAAPGAVAAGYAVYLAYSLLIAPLMVMLAARTFGSLAHPLAATVAVFAGLSALARAIGIMRWLTVMPVLATGHAAALATGDTSARMQIELMFNALTTYGGGIGEVLGVSLLMAAALGVWAVGALRQAALPRWLGVLGGLASLALAALALPNLDGPDLMPVAVAVSLLSLWMLAAGVYFCVRRR
jgi:hypothetical protein